jgi:hypothetical protein
MTRKDYIMLSATLRKVRDSYAPHWDPNLVRACDDHARQLANELAGQSRAFDRQRFLIDAGVTQP